MGVNDTPADWPLGPALKKARDTVGLSQRAAAKIAGISEGRWRQLEKGYQESRGVRIPIGTTPKTVAAAALAVKWDVGEALHVAGFNYDDVAAEIEQDREPDEPTIMELQASPQTRLPVPQLLAFLNDIAALLDEAARLPAMTKDLAEHIIDIRSSATLVASSILAGANPHDALPLVSEVDDLVSRLWGRDAQLAEGLRQLAASRGDHPKSGLGDRLRDRPTDPRAGEPDPRMGQG